MGEEVAEAKEFRARPKFVKARALLKLRFLLKEGGSQRFA
jgi:hypothetical protein